MDRVICCSVAGSWQWVCELLDTSKVLLLLRSAVVGVLELAVVLLLLVTVTVRLWVVTLRI